MEKYINWKLIWSCNKFYIQYELDVNMATIHKLIQDKYVNTYTPKDLFAECFLLCRGISIRSLENYTIGYNYGCENKRIQLLSHFTCNKYPSYRTVIYYLLYFSEVVKKLDKEFLDNSITYLEGNLSFNEIETPKDIRNITNIILYLWKKK